MKKWILILVYLVVWTLVILEHLFLGVISYEKSRFIVALYLGVLVLGLPFTLFKILTEFQIKKNTKWYTVTFSTFFLVICYMIWAGKIDRERLKEEGRLTIGIIDESWTSRRKHLIRVKYNINQQEYTTFSETDHHKALTLGDTVKIIYWTRNPELYKIRD